MNIVLIGIQGCGKGTLVSGLEQHIDFDLISVGQLLRDEVATGSELGEHIRQIQERGQLVDLDIVMEAVNKKLNTSTKSIKIFDGFPRSAEQADALDKIANVDLVLHLELSKDVAIDRILNRLTCKDCGYITKKQNVESNICPKCNGVLSSRTDDTIDAINKRFELYHNETYPLLARYQSKGVVVNVDANRTPDEVLSDVLKVINNEYKY